jgi:hypothetical protein
VPALKNRRALMQGPPSLILFNHFINALLLKLDDIPKISVQGVSLNQLFFADDGALIASNPGAMNWMLSLCESWAHSNGIRFSSPKCATLTPWPNVQFRIHQQEISNKSSVTYLGMTTTRYGINWQDSFKSRVSKCLRTAKWMNSKGMNLNGWRAADNIQIYKTFLCPMLEYGIALASYRNKHSKLCRNVKMSASVWCFLLDPQIQLPLYMVWQISRRWCIEIISWMPNYCQGLFLQQAYQTLMQICITPAKWRDVIFPKACLPATVSLERASNPPFGRSSWYYAQTFNQSQGPFNPAFANKCEHQQSEKWSRREVMLVTESLIPHKPFIFHMLSFSQELLTYHWFHGGLVW